MKENVLDVLMYLFENYMDEEVDVNPDRESLKSELLEAGFPRIEVNKALEWLDGLSALQETMQQQPVVSRNSMRLYTNQEIKKLDTDCRGFLLFLEHVGVLDKNTRELVVDRVMALETDDIDLDQLKWVVLMVLFNQPGQEAALAWIEDLVFDERASVLH